MTTRAAIVETFVDAGELAATVGLLPEALDQLAIRLEALGHLDDIMAYRWVIPADSDDRKPAEPRPKPPPKPPKPKGCDCADCVAHRRTR